MTTDWDSINLCVVGIGRREKKKESRSGGERREQENGIYWKVDKGIKDNFASLKIKF